MGLDVLSRENTWETRDDVMCLAHMIYDAWSGGHPGKEDLCQFYKWVHCPGSWSPIKWKLDLIMVCDVVRYDIILSKYYKNVTARLDLFWLYSYHREQRVQSTCRA